jgi:uncharacterized delta-60 repeat protein
MKFAALLFLLSFSIDFFAQQPIAQWTNRLNGAGDYSDKFNCVATDASGNSYLSGYTVRTGVRKDYLTVKLNSSGDTLWSSTFNGTDSKDDEILAMTIDESGNCYVTGYSKDAQFQDDIITIKYDPNGLVLWTSTYNNSLSGQDDQGNSICIDASGNIVVAGQTEVDPLNPSDDAFIVVSYAPSTGTQNWTFLYDVGLKDRAVKIKSGASGIYVTGRTDNGNDDDVTVLKLSTTGTLLWSLPIDIAGFDDQPSDIHLDLTENSYVCGFAENSSNDDLLLLKISSAGTLLWQQVYAGSAVGNDRASALVVDATGNAYVTGKTDSDPSLTVTNYDYCTLKYNASGQQQWVQTYNGSSNSTDEANALCFNSNGNIIVTGHSDGSSNPLVSDYAIRTICYNTSGAQQWSQSFQGTGNKDENGNAIAALTGGGVIVAGTEQDSESQSDALGLTYTTAGSQGWRSDYHGQGDNSDNVNAIVVDASANTYLAGYMNSRNDLRDMCVIKLNSSGDTLWVRTYNGSDNGIDEATDLKVDNSGNVYVTGYTKESTTDYDITTLKYSPTGALLWVAKFDNGAVSGEDKGAKLILDPSLNVYVTGYVDRNASSLLNEDVVLLKYNNSGMLQWNKQFNGAGNGKDVPSALVYLNSSKIVVTGNSFNGTDQDALTLEFSASGTQLWSKTFNGGSGDDKATGILIDGAENIYISGRTSNGTDNDLLCVQYSVTGVQNWVYTNDSGNGDDEFNAMTIDVFGGLYLAGISSNGNNSDLLLVRLSNTGNELWRKTQDGVGQLNDIATALFFDQNYYVVVAGETESIGNMGQIQSDFWLTKFNEAGDLVWSKTYDSGELYNDGINALAHDNMGNIYVTGNSYIQANQKDIVTIKYDSPLGISDFGSDMENEIQLYPNPTNDAIFLNFSDQQSEWDIMLTDLTGKVVQTLSNMTGEIYINTACLPAGNYILTASSTRQSFSRPFIKK